MCVGGETRLSLLTKLTIKFSSLKLAYQLRICVIIKSEKSISYGVNITFDKSWHSSNSKACICDNCKTL